VYIRIELMPDRVVGKEKRPYDAINFYSFNALKEIFKSAREICKDRPLGCNILYAQTDYNRIVEDACRAGADIIITGAGFPLTMPEASKNYPDVALVPIVSTPKALKILCKRVEKDP